jgi:tetratricopeptide (TPR) repeat protein/alpha-beta hydrolase superfamily lysophospholipase
MDIILPGQKTAIPGTVDPALLAVGVTVMTLAETTVGAVVRGEAVETTTVEIPAGTEQHVVVEVDYGDGVKLWTSLAQLVESGVIVTRDGVARIPAEYPFGPTERGLFSWTAKKLALLVVDPEKSVARFAARELVKKIESNVRSKSEVLSLDANGAFHTFAPPDPDKPTLLFIHGTASSTTGSFGKFLGTKPYRELFDSLKGQVAAFEHQTMSVSPIQNALDIARALPDKTKLHLVSHSRGGLVAELLCLGQFGENDLIKYNELIRRKSEFSESYKEQKQQLLALGALLRQKQFEILRFVRVACPARGTVLASKRLDLYLSVLLNLIGTIPALAGPIYNFVKGTLLETAKQRADPREIPGLEAQMPDSPLVHFLNAKSLASAADLAVIAGDLEAGGGFLQRLKVMATDAFYWQDHDLVVNTSAMYGGMRREKGSYYFFDQGKDVDHFSYFKNPRTSTELAGWLAGKQGGFQPFTPLTAVDKLPPSRGEETLPLLFFVPAEMTTTLAAGNQHVWIDIDRLMNAGVAELRRNDLEAKAILTERYDALLKSLRASYRVVVVPWDWRKSLADAAEKLAATVREELARTPGPVRFLGHSFGGLVVALMAAGDSDLWNQIAQREGRLVMLGTPLQGSWHSVALLAGADRLNRALAMLDPRVTPREVGNLFAGFAPFVETLSADALAEDFWTSRSLTPPPNLDATATVQARIREAIDAHARIRKAIETRTMVAVVGQAPATPAALTADLIPIIETTPLGDGRVTWASAAVGRETELWRVDAPHGNLADFPQLFEALRQLLQSGQTTLLATGTASASLGLTGRGVDPPLLFPTDRDLLDIATGYVPSRAADGAGAAHLLRITIKNANVHMAKYPVLVGHYAGDTIVGGEAAADRALNGALTRRFDLGVYPGALYTSTVVLGDADAHPPGAIVVGLGKLGELTSEKIRLAVADGAVRHAVVVAERDDSDRHQSREPRPEMVSASISTLLIGSGAGSIVEVDAAVEAIVSGVLDANRALRTRGLRVDEIEFVELYETRAAEIAHALLRAVARLKSDLQHDELLGLDELVQWTDSARYDTPVDEYATGWWRRLRITREKQTGGRPGNLRFVALTDRARAESTVQCEATELCEPLIREAVQNKAFDPKVASALYELLVPNDIKDASRTEADVLLVLDRSAARYPWEVLADRLRLGTAPLVTQLGMLRQLETEHYRPHPRAANNRSAFILGDTETPSPWVPLPGAQKEADTVAASLAGYDVNKLLRPKATQVLGELFSAEYKIVHIAAHGNFSEKEHENGVVLGPGQFLAACQFQQMRSVPDLVFINCCHLGQLGEDSFELQTRRPHEFAATVAEALIEMGVPAVVVAGWAVDDAAAALFAATFYKAMVAQTLPFGEAVRLARAETYKQFRHTNTWGAYQCYGNPGFRLELGSSAAPPPRKYCSRREYVQRFDSAVAEAKGLDQATRTNLIDCLRKLLDQELPKAWRDARMLTSYALAMRELGAYDEAIQAIEEALTFEKAEVTLEVLEKLVNMQTRRAQELHRAGADPDEIIALLVKAEKNILWLLDLPGSETAERWSLLAANEKRRAVIDPAVRREALRKAAEASRKAQALTLKNTGQADPYPSLNAALLELLAKSRDPQAVAEEVEGWRTTITRGAESLTDVWKRLGLADLELTVHLAKGTLAEKENIEKIAKAYRRAWTNFGSVSVDRTLHEHFDLIAAAVEKPLDEAVEKIRKKGLNAPSWVVAKPMATPPPPPPPASPPTPPAPPAQRRRKR